MLNEDIREKIKLQISDLASLELAESINKYGNFKNAHEASSILREEIEEITESLDEIKRNYEMLWNNVRTDTSIGKIASILEFEAINLCYEAIQVLAMSRKAKLLYDR